MDRFNIETGVCKHEVISGGTITGCSAAKSGSAIEVHGYLYMTGGTVTGNYITGQYGALTHATEEAVDAIRGGAVNFYQHKDTGENWGRLFLSGNPKIYGNLGIDRKDRNVNIARFDYAHHSETANPVNKILVNGALEADAKIGVYAPDENQTTEKKSHYKETEDFALYADGVASKTNFLIFRNDRVDGLVGMDKGNDNKIFRE